MKTRFIVLGLAAVLCLAGAQTFQAASGQTPTPTGSPEASPTPTSGPLGSISGRVYVDVNGDGVFGGPDVPLEFPLSLFRRDEIGPQPLFLGQGSAGDGTYRLTDLPTGNYELSIQIPIPSCAVPIQPFTWVGDTFTGLSCPFVHLTTPSRTYTLAVGENAIDIDFPEVPPSYDVTARIWLNASPVSTANNSVAITAGERECWTAQINRTLTTAGIPVSFYNAPLLPSSNPACQGGDLDITIDGRPAGATSQWSRFWRDSLFSPGARPLNQSSDAFLSSVDLEVSPFLGISGQAVEAGTVTPETVTTRQLVPDGTEVRAFVGTTACGSTKTKTLTTSTGGFGGNLFGLIVPPASVKPGCGTPGAAVSFCVGDFKARQPAAGPWSSVQSPEAKPVQWAAPALADITLEPTTERCLLTEGPRLPQELPSTGSPPN